MTESVGADPALADYLRALIKRLMTSALPTISHSSSQTF